MAVLTQLSDFIFVLGGISICVALVLLLGLYVRLAKGKRADQPAAIAPSPAEMAILFQTMRGVIHEQKTLAREFNQSVDKKVALIREVVAKVIEEHRKLSAQQREIEQKLDTIKSNLGAVEKRVAAWQDDAVPEADEPTRWEGETLSSPAVTTSPLGSTAASPAPVPFWLVARPEEAESAADLIDNWVGLDIVGRKRDTEAVDETEAAPLAPHDPETARKAFRALLNMSADPSVSGKSPEASEPQAAEGGNGRGKAAPVRTRVFEYHDAGMSIGEIAQELGIGKGEVRLILSLREKRKPV